MQDKVHSFPSFINRPIQSDRLFSIIKAGDKVMIKQPDLNINRMTFRQNRKQNTDGSV